ncbi:hypothetical protein [Staphylococcus epidermidis]|uniref:hypothetical protein n=1 Tax=Staphylococcus epidermidis TaxID=1282 RepID=UPI00024E5027|nr:hypothetical protein [Staphylococcus epidermidis]EHS01521.1 hypothetical protein SEVCU128_1221 [Staphylococcus epidermidis VCU128]MBF2284302.1 hypothetical protein [Staphylococcus epidermidis]MBF2289029.1 hypothetical protein [Staphylococcus epidermidis]MBF2291177.1 hypothetical protein [Staphylococcus epidermidis]MBF2293798.1 hypothetical protein [Staphylococcus epidermidis]
MSINIDPEKFAELVVTSNSAKSDEAEDIAKESLILYINAYRLAEKYANIATNCYDTAEILKEINEVDLQLK